MIGSMGNPELLIIGIIVLLVGLPFWLSRRFCGIKETEQKDADGLLGKKMERINIIFLASFFFTNLFQGRGFLRFQAGYMELNGRIWDMKRIVIILLLSIPFGFFPGFVWLYFFGRKRKTVRIEYNDKLSFSKTNDISGKLIFEYKDDTGEAKIRSSIGEINRINELIKQVSFPAKKTIE